MKKKADDLYVELAELVHANVSGPMEKKLVADAQKKLVKKLEEHGALSSEEADGLNV